MSLRLSLRVCLCAVAGLVNSADPTFAQSETISSSEWLSFGNSAEESKSSLPISGFGLIEPAGYTTHDPLPHDAPPANPFFAGEVPIVDRALPALDFRWEPDSSGLGVVEFSGGVQFPDVPLFAGPPAMLSLNAGLTDFDGLPLGEFYRFSVGLDWLYPVSERLTWSFNLTPAIATDFDNFSSDIWQIRASAMALIQEDSNLQWLLGVIVTGREDIPILPAAGVIVWLDERTRLDLMFPRPRISRRLHQDAAREQWLYMGGELGGGTWATEFPNGFEDEISYRAYRLVFGVEFVPTGTRQPFNVVAGQSAYIETGLSFGRQIEFEHVPVVLKPDSAFYLGGGVRF